MADVLTTIVNNLEFYILQEIEKDLDYQEKISMIFLMGDYTKPIDLINPINEETILSEFVAKNKYKWKEKCLEALCLINNRKVLKKLGLEDEDLEKLVSSKTISPVIKSLYKLCESLTDDEAKQLLRKLKYNLQQTVDNELYLEMYILKWINEEYIVMKQDKTWHISDIMLKHLKNLNRDNIYTTLIKSTKEKFFYDRNDTNESTITIKKALCIIINQMNFNGKDQTYNKRIGTNADAKKLQETFESFGFEVFVFDDLTKNRLLDAMKNIPKNFGTSWDCLFFCILSHGNEGTIVTSDEEEISLQTIDDCICTPALLNVMKIVIIQACQGEKKGVSINKLRIDGPCVDNKINKIAETSSKTNFCIFMSTMSGFISVRHQEDGSWFIQTLCKVLEEKENITFSEFTREVTKRTKEYRGTVDDIPLVTQLPELIKSRFMKDFKFPPKRDLSSIT